MRTLRSILRGCCGQVFSGSSDYYQMVKNTTGSVRNFNVQEDDTACLAIVDLPASQRKNQPKFVFSESHIVDPDLFTNRPGLEILQVSWHPGQMFPQLSH